MKGTWFIRLLILTCAIFFITGSVFAQERNNLQAKSQEVSESDGVPVLTKHLPDYENARNRASYILNQNDLRRALGERQIFDLIDFQSGTEAVTAPYSQGKLLIVEYSNPQSSVDADNRIKQLLSENSQNPGVVYRRIGNYNAFVLDAADVGAANGLLDQIKYEKTVQWLGTDPFAFKRAERAFIESTSSLFYSTVVAIVSGLGLSVLGGLCVGILFFYYRNQKRANMQAFSDAGGMTRLNLDELTSTVSTDKLLGD
ncbi:MAG: hypothetical protein M3033_11035 [Acidobacteriota bacterium]|nr:hypothetical protein [Acidobacteriota bacterium]